jgi:hypothetical protein
MGRMIEQGGEWYEVSDYLEEHRLQNQTSWAAPGIPLNPVQREDFDCTPNEERDPLEVQDWWGVLYIETYSWSGDPTSEGAEEWRAHWLSAWPTGVRYDVRCLDGGAWDRSTNRGSFATLELAVAAILDKQQSR